MKRAWSVRLMALALLFIVQEPIYNFVAATWVSHNIYFQDAISTITRVEVVRAVAYRDLAGIPTVCFARRAASRWAMATPSPNACASSRPACARAFGSRIKGRSAPMSLSCKSTLARKLNASDVTGACNELTK
ncbi:lysozyme [Rhizobium laguerreae]|uniref:lysozyme n=2 Tax=Rhizobium laguerreae TaxID=1076926 RepID=UPI00143F7A4D|nr:lysozyme [Rhizobium laguerreae]